MTDENTSDQKAELHKFLQIIKNDEENADRLKEILDGLEKDQIWQCSSYDGDKNALHMAIDRGMLWAVRQLLDYAPVSPDDTSPLSSTHKGGRYPLHFACLRGHRDIADLLLQRGADIDARGKNGATPLDDACFQGHKDVVELLISRGANTQMGDYDGWSPVRTAVAYENLDIVEMLLNANPANISKGDDGGETPLHVASKKGNVDIMNLLLERGADIDKPDDDRETPLHAASRWGMEKSVRLLLKEKAKTDRTNNDGETPLHVASRRGHESVVAVLVKEYDDIDEVDNNGKTPLCVASEQRNVECVNTLCEAGADCNWTAEWSEGYNAPLHYVFELSEKKDESPDERKKKQSTIVTKLLAHGADPELLNMDKQTVLHLAAQAGNWDVYRDILKLLKEGQNRLKNTHGRTPLAMALRFQADEIVEVMTDSETASLFDSGDELEALLWAAQSEEKHHYLESLFEARKDLRDEIPDGDTSSWSAIQWATYLELPEVLEMLQKTTETTTPEEEKPEIQKPEMPTAGAEQEEFLKHWSLKAAVTECRVQDDRLTLATKFRSVQDAIYGTGPVSATITKEDRLGEENFTWVHLPATNMIWMKDLLKRILPEAPSCLSNNVSAVNEFFESSWSQIPDATSKSRIMKPQCVSELMLHDDDSTEHYLRAAYIPYLALSRQQHRGQDRTGNDDEGKQQRDELEKEESDGRDQRAVEQQAAYDADAYRGLLKCYEGEVIHGSTTLDECFYGFSTLAQQQESLHGDRPQRSDHQAVIKTIHPEGVAEGSDWALVRVNQLWIWVVGHKWLITATTHPIDQAEGAFLTDALDHIERQAAWARSPHEMAKVVFACCVDAYDRPPKPKLYETDHSIRQILSDSIKNIARKDVSLFQDFCEHMEAKQQKEDGPEGQQTVKKAAASLVVDIRIILDELQMIKAMGNHQTRVWKKLRNGYGLDNRRWESHISSDIEDMITSADRIRSNVEMMLSLAHQQIANNQAKESLKQSEIAIAQARKSFKQGRMTTIFTGIAAFCVGVPALI
ncbi:hypothetical protein NCS52_00128400 [Fusarium sp. LHS14.1]|nr:hypothetical protein NCS52_00128400 [Fusarium sp. LHS14.1]